MHCTLTSDTGTEVAQHLLSYPYTVPIQCYPPCYPYTVPMQCYPPCYICTVCLTLHGLIAVTFKILSACLPMLHQLCFFLAGDSIVMQHLAEQHTSLASEMKKFSFYGHICAMKGLLQALPPSILTVPLTAGSSTHQGTAGTAEHADRNAPSLQADGSAATSAEADESAAPSIFGEGSTAASLEADGSAAPSIEAERSTAPRSWLLLTDGALPACCAAVVAATDAHHKFHAFSALALCLERVKQCLQVGSHSASDTIAAQLM